MVDPRAVSTCILKHLGRPHRSSGKTDPAYISSNAGLRRMVAEYASFLRDRAEKIWMEN